MYLKTNYLKKCRGYESVSVLLVCTFAVFIPVLSACTTASPQDNVAISTEWQEEFNLLDRDLSDSGESLYFILKPGFQMILESTFEKLTITVLEETKVINGISTRVLEEREERNGELREISRNFFAIDQKTGDVFYFGEEVDIYSNGQVTSHSGVWLAYENGNLPGLIMPGNPLVGMKYYQEIAPGVAQDRAEIINLSINFQTQAGEFSDCLLTQESSKVSPLAIEYKTYCPGVGLVQDETLHLVRFGYIE
jgi:hypothetical protein